MDAERDTDGTTDAHEGDHSQADARMFGGINQIRAAAEHIGQPDADRQRDRNRNHRAAPCRQFAVQRLEAKQRAVHQRTNQTGHQSQRNQPHILFQRQLTDITEIQNRTQTETVF